MTLRASTGVQAVNSRPALFNADPSFMLNWKQAAANVRKGTAHAVIAYMGDSLVNGAWSDGNIAGLWNQTVPARLAAYLTQLGTSCGSANELNNHALDASGTLTNFNHFDSRVVVGAGWASDTTNADLSPGGFWWLNSTTTNAWTFTPTVPFDSVDLSYVQFSGGGSFTVDIDGVGQATVNTNGASTFLTQTVAKGSPGTTVNIKRVSGTVAIQGPVCYQAGVKELHILDLGYDGAKAQDYAGMAAFQTVNNLSPKLTIITLGYNDAQVPRTMAQISADLTTTVTAAKLSGDVMLTTYNPIATGTLALATQQALNSTIKSVAVANNCWCADFNALFGSNYTAMQTAGLISDGLHPAATGYDAEAMFLANILAAA